ncbi:uncharacterized protein K02A2.6-like [Trichonephila clavipes]|uniref:Uncharacterized protein K02A2.6-like n=1 Tax=Trichonephila clavipes TaxID=2585209 RepID=A0A8X6R973_TRICX|nr:uncharacterized protein K02A2.6-like [Trichonephila clavipes]
MCNVITPPLLLRVEQSTLTLHPVKIVRLKDTREMTQTDVRDGTFDSEITKDDQIFPVTISVVPNSCTNYDLIIGCDVIKQAHLNISPTGVKFAQILRPSDNANENFIMTISNGSSTFDIGPNVSQHNRAEVEQLLSTYTPKKTKTVNIELDIALTDHEPIFHKPGRLPFAERDIVDA